jgi:hypothetical protein
MRLREIEQLDLPSSDIHPSEYICVYQAVVVHALSRTYSSSRTGREAGPATPVALSPESQAPPQQVTP